MTLIKNKTTGEWENVSGGSRTWVGAKAKLLDEIADGNVGDGTITLCPTETPPEAGFVQGGSYHHIAGLMSRGVVPAGISIDDMVGPEWVGTWYINRVRGGHFPMVAGSEYNYDMFLDVRSISADITEQRCHPWGDTSWEAKRMYVRSQGGWRAASNTPVVDTFYGGWQVRYNYIVDVFIGQAAAYGIKAYFRTNVNGDVSLFLTEPTDEVSLPAGTRIVLYTPILPMEVLWSMGLSTARYSWAHWGHCKNWAGIEGYIGYDTSDNCVYAGYAQDCYTGCMRMHFLPLDW